MIDQKEEDRMLSDWGLPVPTRDINVDVHVGNAIQKPYASFEHLLARKRTGYTSFEDLKAAVEAAYPNGQQGSKIEQADDGGIFRWVKGNTGRTVGAADGTLMVETFEERVPVSMSQAGAKTATAAGVRTDWFNGWTWVRGGEKLERDGNVLAARPEANPNRKLDFEPADEAAQMAHRAAVAATVSRLGITPMPAPAAPKADAKKGGN